jgi:hypothetical protein
MADSHEAFAVELTERYAEGLASKEELIGVQLPFLR